MDPSSSPSASPSTNSRWCSLVAIETAPGESPEQVLQTSDSLEQASHHLVAAAIVAAAMVKGLKLQVSSKARETLGSGLEGVMDGRDVRVGSHQLVYGSRKPEEWAMRALRRAAWRSALSVFVAVDGRSATRYVDQRNGVDNL